VDKLETGAKKLGLRLNARQLKQFSVYYHELIDWNRRINLTAITDFEGVQVKHFLDSLTVTLALKHPLDNASFRAIDIGTGAGLPGIPLKILLPNIKLTLLDANAKKARFLEALKSRLALNDVETVVGRAEDVAHSRYRESFDIVLSRAVAILPTLVELALPFCAIGGTFIAQKGKGAEAETAQATKAIGLLGGKMRQLKRIELEELIEERRLVIIDKVSPTPAQYPRRPGMPAKRPLVR
jgi:16S rRNA (guanine527-N7)-methyltransferase